MDEPTRTTGERNEPEQGATEQAPLGLLIPLLVAACLLLDLACRPLSIAPLSFRASEPLTRFRLVNSSLQPNATYRNEQSYGDLSAMLNLPFFRQYRLDAVASDRLGFRNSPADNQTGTALGAAPQILVCGDSFFMGTGASDGETLTDHLRGLYKGAVGVYNVAGIGDADMIYPLPLWDADRIIDLADRLGMKNGIVLLDQLERAIPVSAATEERVREENRMRTMLCGWFQQHGLTDGLATLRGLTTVSPLAIACRKVHSAIENGRVLPNPGIRKVASAELQNGDVMLFLRDRSDPNLDEMRYQPSELHPSVFERWSRISQKLRQRGLRLVIVLVPNKYTVYRQFLLDRQSAPSINGNYLDWLEMQLTERQIPCVNLEPALSAAAEQRLNVNEYVYWNDDTHWNSEGMKIAAERIKQATDPLLQQINSGQQ